MRNKLPHVRAQRRLALLHLSAVIGMAISAPIKMFRQPEAEPIATISHDPLLGDAREFLADIFARRGPVIVGPISLLQRHFSLGYGRAITLAVNLEKLNVWSIYHDRAGMRSARKGPENGHGEK